MAERYSQHGCIKRGLRAWIMSQGMHRIGLVDTDGDGLLDDRLAVQLHTELYQHVLSSSDMWMRAVYLIVNEGLSLPGGPGAQWAGDAHDGADHVGLSQLPSLFGLELPVRKHTSIALCLHFSARARVRSQHLVASLPELALSANLLFQRACD